MAGRLLAIAVFALSMFGGTAVVAPGAAHADGIAVRSGTVRTTAGWYPANPGAEPFGGRLRGSRNLFQTYTTTLWDCGYYPVTRRRHGEVYVRWVRRCAI